MRAASVGRAELTVELIDLLAEIGKFLGKVTSANRLKIITLALATSDVFCNDLHICIQAFSDATFGSGTSAKKVNPGCVIRDGETKNLGTS